MKFHLTGVALIDGKALAVGWRVVQRDKGTFSAGGSYSMQIDSHTAPLSDEDARIVLPVLRRITMGPKRRKRRRPLN